MMNVDANSNRRTDFVTSTSSQEEEQNRIEQRRTAQGLSSTHGGGGLNRKDIMEWRMRNGQAKYKSPLVPLHVSTYHRKSYEYQISALPHSK